MLLNCCAPPTIQNIPHHVPWSGFQRDRSWRSITDMLRAPELRPRMPMMSTAPERKIGPVLPHYLAARILGLALLISNGAGSEEPLKHGPATRRQEGIDNRLSSGHLSAPMVEVQRTPK